MLEQTIPAVIGSVLKVHVPAITFINPDNHKLYCNQAISNGNLIRFQKTRTQHAQRTRLTLLKCMLCMTFMKI